MPARASVVDTVGVMADVVVPLLAKGVIARRPAVVGVAERLDGDRRAIRRLTKLRDRYGPGPLMLRVPGRDVALVLSPADVDRVLVGQASEFKPANREKRAALSHFQPRGVLVSDGAERGARREFTEAVLDTGRPVHRLGEELVARAREEAAAITEGAAAAGELTWDRFAVGWWRMVRRVVLGDHARDDRSVTDTLTRLRRDANWAFLKPKRTRLRQRLHRELGEHLARAESGSLAGLIASMPSSAEAAATDQVSHWLFAFDAAGMASFRALALIDAHPSYASRVREELQGTDPSGPRELPLLRAAVLESVRLWPTTPVVLRDTASETSWGSATLPRGTAVAIFAPFFHRDREQLSYADRFSPELWLAPPSDSWPLIPFSAGPAVCPGRNLVLLLTSTVVGTLLESHSLRQAQRRRLDGAVPLPATLSPFGLCFRLDAPGG